MRSIREITAEDLPAIVALHEHINPSPWSLALWQQCLGMEGYQNWLVEEKGQLTAFICVSSWQENAEILNIGVAPEQQGKGLGAELLEASIKLFPDSVTQIFLEVRRSNIPAIGLYKKLGFKQVGERKGYYRLASGVTEDALVWQLKLTNTDLSKIN